MINLNQLRAFYFVAKYSSFTIAAKKLFISQPAVTAQVKLFEKHHDLKLFNKHGKNLILTHPGKLLFKKAIQIFKFEDEVENTLAQIKKTNQGKHRILSHTIKKYMMRRKPYYRFKLTQDN